MNESGRTFEEFLLWERSSRDTLEVKRIYVDMAGDLVAGIALSQIVYWHLPSREGKPRLQVERQGHLWLAKARTEWWDECRLSPKQADRALDLLRARGLIDVRVFKFAAAPTKHVRILHEAFLKAWRDCLARETGSGSSGGSGGTSNDLPQRSNSISTKGQNGFSPKGDGDLSQTVRTYSTEITTETTASAAVGEGRSNSDADASLIEELVSNGVGRKAAEGLAREKPAVCRQCLEYLPYAKLRATPGAWLANAIRDEYGPPEGYVKAMQRTKPHTASNPMPRQASQEALCQEKLARLGTAYEAMEKSNEEALIAFNRYVEEERSRVAQVTRGLTEKGRDRLLASFEDRDRRLELFDQWLKSADARWLVYRATTDTSGPSLRA